MAKKVLKKVAKTTAKVAAPRAYAKATKISNAVKARRKKNGNKKK